VAALTAAAALIAAVLLPFWRGQRNGPDEGANPEKNIAAAPPHPAPADKIDPAPVADHLFGEIRRMSAPGQLKSLALSPDGKLAYAGTHTGQIHVWNLASGDKVRTIGTRSSIKKIRLSSDGARLAAVGASMLSVFDPQTGVEEFNLRLAVPVFDLAFLPDDRHLLVSCFAGPGIDEMAKRSVGVLFDHHGLTVVDAVTGKQVRTLRVERPCFFYCVACSPDGKWFAAGTQDGSVFVIDAATGKQVHALKTTLGCAFSVAFSDDSKRLYASDNGNHLHGWRLDDYSEIFRCRLAHPYTSFRFSPDETWLAVNGNRECTLLDLTHRLSQGIIALPGHESSISDVAFLPSSDQLVSCSWDGTLRLWKLPPRPARK
jgi:WD40 repeat protein